MLIHKTPLPLARWFRACINSLTRVVIWGVSASVLLAWCCFGECHADQFALIETDAKIEIHRKGKLLVCYNKESPAVPAGIDPVYQRTGFLHPVCSPDGKEVTASFPYDHPHQQGIFSAWVKTNYNGRTPDFWNLKKGTGRVLHKRVLDVFSGNAGTGFAVELVHRSEEVPKLDILRETWTVTAVPTDGSFHCFDLDTKQEALTDLPLQIEKFHYGGVAVRGPVEWLLQNDRDLLPSVGVRDGAAAFLNSFGSDRVKGNHERPNWVAMSGVVQGKPVSVTVLCADTAFRAPQSTRLHPTKPYFCFCPCVDGSFVINKKTPYQASYRFLICDSKPDREWIDQRWLDFNAN